MGYQLNYLPEELSHVARGSHSQFPPYSETHCVAIINL